MTATEGVPQTAATEMVFPGRYYCRFPFEEPQGYQEEQQCLARAQTAFMLVDVYGLGYGDGEPEPEYPTLFLRRAFEREREIVREHIRPALEAARKADLPIIYVSNYSPRIADNHSEFGKLCYRTETGFRGTIEEVFAEGSSDLAFSSIIAPRSDDYLVRKQMYDGFFETPLDSLLRNLGIKNLVCVGFSAEICLLQTLISAMYRNYRVILLRDCTLASEFVDTVEDWALTAMAVRYVESLVGFTTTSSVFIDACAAALAHAGSRYVS